MAISFTQSRKSKIASAITASGTGLAICSTPDQMGFISQWADSVSKVFVHGDVIPPSKDGIRWYQSSSNPTVLSVLTKYIGSIPGNEVLVIAAPNVQISQSQELMNFVAASRMELSWAAKVPGRGFVMTSSVAAHLLNVIPSNMTFDMDWYGLIDAWLKRNMLSHRYFDAERFRVLTLPEPVAALAEEQQPAAEPTKEPNPKKKKK